MISTKEFANVIGVVQNYTDACWRRNECIEMHVWKLSVGSEKLKFDQIRLMLWNNWLGVSLRPSSYDVALGRLPSTRAARVAQGYRPMRLLLFSHA